MLGYLMNVQGTGNGPLYICLKLSVGHSLAGNVLRPAIGKLNDHRRIDLGRRFQRGIDAAVSDRVDGGEGELIVLGILIQCSQ